MPSFVFAPVEIAFRGLKFSNSFPVVIVFRGFWEQKSGTAGRPRRKDRRRRRPYRRRRRRSHRRIRASQGPGCLPRSRPRCCTRRVPNMPEIEMPSGRVHSGSPSFRQVLKSAGGSVHPRLIRRGRGGEKSRWPYWIELNEKRPQRRSNVLLSMNVYTQM